MFRALSRILSAIGGACAASLVVAVIEAQAMAHGEGEAVASGVSQGLAVTVLLGVLLPVTLVVGVAVGCVSWVLEPGSMKSPRDWATELRGGSVLERLRNAALVPLLVGATFAWCLGSAHLARATLSTGTPASSGWMTAVASLALLFALLLTVLALVPLVRRTLALVAEHVPRALDPVVTGLVAVVAVTGAFAYGIFRGDVGGEGGLLGIFGVLRRAELDLTPLAHVAIVIAFAYLGALAVGRRRHGGAEPNPHRLSLACAVAAVLALAVLCGRAASILDSTPSVVRRTEKSAALGKVSLSLLRRATDRDRDGVSRTFGGGDCDDNDATTNPNALDVPGDGRDQDCTGEDTPMMAAVEPASAKEAPPQDLPAHNVILITIDTLRTDLGFLGYAQPVSPNLDKLAGKSAIFERAYAMASYTGKSVGPMLIGKYPSETRRDGSHFNTYLAANTLVAERAHDAGFRTLSAHCHWYFRNPTGLNQGMDTWDTSAVPPGGGDLDTTSTSERLADVALRLLADPANVSTPSPSTTPPDGPGSSDGGSSDGGSSDGGTEAPGAGHFFAWFHFVDPHAQYVPHAEAPKFEGPSEAKALYDGEVWFTDKHVGRILDYVASQPWGADTAIVITADHGEAFSDHGMRWHGRELWESLVRVPLIVYVPGQQPVRVPAKRSQIDLVPTLLELMGLSAPPGELRGKSLLADLRVSGGAFEERDVYIDMPQGPYNPARRALISGPGPGMKLIDLGGANYQLYDLATDPAEGKDLADDRAAVRPLVTRMQQLRGGLHEIDVPPTR